MLPMGEEVECHLSLADRIHLHEGFCMEASRIFIFSHFNYVDASCAEGKGVNVPCEQGKGIGDD